MKTSEILKSLRVENNLKQKELAEKLGIGQSTIVGYERGLHEDTANIISRYAEFFNVSVDFLCGLEDELGNKLYTGKKYNSTYYNPPISDEENKLIGLFRNMSHPQKIRFLSFGEGLTEPLSSSKKHQ